MKKRSPRILLGLIVTAFVFNYIWPRTEQTAVSCEPHHEAVEEHLRCIVDLQMMRMRPSRNRKNNA